MTVAATGWVVVEKWLERENWRLAVGFAPDSTRDGICITAKNADGRCAEGAGGAENANVAIQLHWPMTGVVVDATLKLDLFGFDSNVTRNSLEVHCCSRIDYHCSTGAISRNVTNCFLCCRGWMSPTEVLRLEIIWTLLIRTMFSIWHQQICLRNIL